MYDVITAPQLIEKPMPHTGSFVCYEDHEIILLVEFTWQGPSARPESLDFWLWNKRTYRRYSLHRLQKCRDGQDVFYQLALIAETPAPETSKLLVSGRELGPLNLKPGNRFSLRFNCIERQEADYYDAHPCEFKAIPGGKEGFVIISV